jgi:hypothetical protein
VVFYWQLDWTWTTAEVQGADMRTSPGYALSLWTLGKTFEEQTAVSPAQPDFNEECPAG